MTRDELKQAIKELLAASDLSLAEQAALLREVAGAESPQYVPYIDPYPHPYIQPQVWWSIEVPTTTDTATDSGTGIPHNVSFGGSMLGRIA